MPLRCWRFTRRLRCHPSHLFVFNLPHLETKMLTKPHAPCQVPYEIICFPNAQVKLQICSAIVVVLSYILWPLDGYMCIRDKKTVIRVPHLTVKWLTFQRLISITNLMHKFFYSITICVLHYDPRHVSSINMPIFRRTNYIHTASGIVALRKRLQSKQAESRLLCSLLSSAILYNRLQRLTIPDAVIIQFVLETCRWFLCSYHQQMHFFITHIKC